eukprot:GHVS01049244.1.p1 GENE.GHVS01049244.1~~GHVS01049244.1.p1  ORF type:complete len:204 (+),score=53.54 GHVS01049244.1:275-886(+)
MRYFCYLLLLLGCTTLQLLTTITYVLGQSNCEQLLEVRGDCGCKSSNDKHILFDNIKTTNTNKISSFSSSPSSSPSFSSSSFSSSPSSPSSSFSSSTNPSNIFFTILFSCGKTCFGDISAIQKCIQNKLLLSYHLTITNSCSLCYAQSAHCGAMHCTVYCMFDVCSQSCLQCGETNCNGKLKKCTKLDILPSACQLSTTTSVL